MKPTKWDSKAKRMGKRLTKRKKLSLLQRYEKEMRRGKNREQILAKIAQEIGVSSIRQVERILAQAKDFREEIKKHFVQISTIALKLVQILEWYYKNHLFNIEPIIASDFPYTTHTDTPMLNERELTNLLAHVGNEIPELESICEYHKTCEKWSSLGDKKWEEQKPSFEITEDLVYRLKLQANKVSFTGKCPDCPR